MNNPPRRASSAWRRSALVLLLLIPTAVWPLAAIVWRAAAPDGALSVPAIADTLLDAFAWQRLAVTAAQALVSTGLSLVVGLPAAYVLSQLRFRGRGLLRSLITVPLVLPTIAVALGFQQLLGPLGWISVAIQNLGGAPYDATGTLSAILIAHVCFGVAIIVRIVTGAWESMDAQQEEAARVLGASQWRTFRSITIPMLLPACTSAAALVFMFAFTSFGVVLILGTPLYDTLEVTIYRLATPRLDVPQAAALSVVQLITTLAVLTLYSATQRRSAAGVRPHADRTRPLSRASRREQSLMLLVSLTTLLLVALPMAALVAGAITRDGAFTSDYFAALIIPIAPASTAVPIEAIGWSLLFAVGATVIALVAGTGASVVIARSRGSARVLHAMLMLPLAVPAVVLAFGYRVAFDGAWGDLGGSAALVLMAHSLIAYPFVLRAVLPVARSINSSLIDAAATLGATPTRSWRYVELPILSRAVRVGALFAFAMSLGELGATLLLGHPEFATAPVAIFNALGQPDPDSAGRALALATILAGTTVVAFVFIERSRRRDTGDL